MFNTVYENRQWWFASNKIWLMDVIFSCVCVTKDNIFGDVQEIMFIICCNHNIFNMKVIEGAVRFDFRRKRKLRMEHFGSWYIMRERNILKKNILSWKYLPSLQVTIILHTFTACLVDFFFYNKATWCPF